MFICYPYWKYFRLTIVTFTCNAGDTIDWLIGLFIGCILFLWQQISMLKPNYSHELNCSSDRMLFLPRSTHFWRISLPSTTATKLPKANRPPEKSYHDKFPTIIGQRVNTNFNFFRESGQSLSISWQYNSKLAWA